MFSPKKIYTLNEQLIIFIPFSQIEIIYSIRIDDLKSHRFLTNLTQQEKTHVQTQTHQTTSFQMHPNMLRTLIRHIIILQ